MIIVFVPVDVFYVSGIVCFTTHFYTARSYTVNFYTCTFYSAVCYSCVALTFSIE